MSETRADGWVYGRTEFMETELLTAADTLQRLDELSSLLIGVVEQGASIGFTLPLGGAEAGEYWRKVAGEVDAGNKVLVIARDEQGDLLGSAQLAKESRANGRQRFRSASRQRATTKWSTPALPPSISMPTFTSIT